MSVEQGEQDLVRRAVAGEAAAFDRLVEIHSPRLYRLMRRTAPDAQEAEALVQETWLRAWQHRRRCNTARPFFPWLARIAMNLARDAWRKRRPIDFADVGEVVEGIAGDEVPLEGKLEAEALRRRLAGLIEELRPERRMVIALRYDAGLEYREIAATLGIPLNTVRTHLRRAKVELRARLEEEDGRPMG
jgi:RNA polymerase sigma-70 factor (ECF subfamily)